MLRFENLSGDASLDWAGRALSDILTGQLDGIPLEATTRGQQGFAPHLARAPGLSSELSTALDAGATRTLTGYFTAEKGILTVTAVERDNVTQKNIRTVTTTGNVISAAGALARQLASAPRASPTQSEAALRSYSEGIETGGPAAFADFQQATTEDPKFGEAYLAWTRAAAAAGNRPELERGLALGIQHGAELLPLDRAYLSLESADLRQNRDARIEALATIVKLTPGDPANLQTLGDAEFNARRFGPAIEHFRQAIALVPDNGEVLNLLTYSRMFAGDYPGALASVRDYQQRKPGDTNAIDSEGDVHFYFGNFAEAEKRYLQAFDKEPNFQDGADGWKAARARLMTGDVPGATQLFRRFQDARVKAVDASVAFRAAEWLYIIGQRAEGSARMVSAGDAATNPDVRSLCYTQAAIWETATGHNADGARHAALALQSPRPGTFANAAIARFLSQPGASEAEWTARAQRGFNGSGADALRRLAAAYAHFVARQLDVAAVEWKAIYEEGNPNDQAATFLYAGALAETGRNSEASAIVKTNPIPAPAPRATWECLYFPALFSWRGDQTTFTRLGGIPARAK